MEALKSAGPAAPGSGALGAPEMERAAGSNQCVALNQEIIAWAEEGFGLEVTLPWVSVKQAHREAWPADGMC